MLFFGNIDRVRLFFFITEDVDINTILFLDFVELFDSYWKFNFSVIQILNVLFVGLLDPLRVCILWIQMSDVAPSKAFIILVFDIN